MQSGKTKMGWCAIALLCVALGSALFLAGRAAAGGPLAEPGRPAPAGAGNSKVENLLKSNGCVGCHSVSERRMGPSYREIAERYKDNKKAQSLLVDKVINGGSGNWGSLSMPPNPNLSKADAGLIVRWIRAQRAK